ncbi:TPA: hypothetical protein QDC20_001638 [Burkholderia aenigmatica]|uniref:hypothetical protein n=1 Tax=Burkholderia sp. AU45251 TaxID=3059204 RepID=UPI0026502AE4|nr:hypothetical protein [Burkholderia sp. AU45251]HDR9482117.1 hypothetical protein [Burkholderia aenigmatica]MDN7515248.1 hypothetical protein [Burkholderia sp. AU45251]HDR9515584.1 hypothetical protein [Burkholderia aenigmatica]HDR9590488.1 hypothetical protein [Burkholderia aenigmatica]HDR9598861.1 hypothetical protein [Burkholderia aenigmatica]
MFDLDRALLAPDRRPVTLRDVAGNRGLIAVGVGRAGERGFQMVHRFHDVGEQLAAIGIHLAFVYPRESARHVLDPLSAASARFRCHPHLLLDWDGRCFTREVPPRSLATVYQNGEMRRLADVVDLRGATWESEFRAFVARCTVGVC